MSGGVHFRGLAPGLHSPEEPSQQWQVGLDPFIIFQFFKLTLKFIGFEKTKFKLKIIDFEKMKFPFKVMKNSRADSKFKFIALQKLQLQFHFLKGPMQNLSL